MTTKTKKRIIGRWTIGETLGKGGYSWVKKGQDIKTGKMVALKFMEKADNSWAQEQAVQVETEIDALKNVRHKNVMKLYAYNLNCQYPSSTANGKLIDTILLVLEYAPGGELFDILYYTKSLDEVICRTYFQQIVNGVEACHNAGVIHRDLKPQNLLLDSSFNIKITDFGLSKIVKCDKQAIMTTMYVGTKGYQAPELLRGESYDIKCDVFSVGVILFILLAGYPPFEQASKTDKWFKALHKKNYAKFWKAHHKCPIVKNNMKVISLLEKMLASDPKERITLADVKKHEWYSGETIKNSELLPILKDRHRLAEKRRRADVRKMADLGVSINPRKPIQGLIENGKVDLFPEDETESIYDIYTYGKWWNIYNLIEEWMPDRVQGLALYDFELNMLHCTAKVLNDCGVTETIKFDIKVYESRVWKGKAPAEFIDNESLPEQQKKYDDKIYVVRVVFLEGNRLTFNKIKDNFLLKICSPVLKGLPKWARAMVGDDEQTANEMVDEQKDDNVNVQVNDDYSSNVKYVKTKVDYEMDAAVEDDEYDGVLNGDGEMWAVNTMC